MVYIRTMGKVRSQVYTRTIVTGARAFYELYCAAETSKPRRIRILRIIWYIILYAMPYIQGD